MLKIVFLDVKTIGEDIDLSAYDALGEVVNVFAIMARRLKIRQGTGWMICAMALGKTLGSLLFFQKGW